MSEEGEDGGSEEGSGEAETRPLRDVRKARHYILATLAGEHLDYEFDEDIHTRNRALWHRWATQDLDDDALKALIDAGTIPAGDVADRALEPVIEAARERGLTSLPSPSETIDFAATIWPLPIQCFDGFWFPTEVDFQGARTSRTFSFMNATFQHDANFEGATFQHGANFVSATFEGDAYFERAMFDGEAYFENVTFEGKAKFTQAMYVQEADFTRATFKTYAHFDRVKFKNFAFFTQARFQSDAIFVSARFKDRAVFSRATFKTLAAFTNAMFGDEVFFYSAKFMKRGVFANSTFEEFASFKHAKFKDEADFGSATFQERVLFENSVFSGTTLFNNAHFKRYVPKFFGARLHEGTFFHDVTWPQVPRNSPDDARNQADAYERLKLEMDRLNRHEAELRFFAKELTALRNCTPPHRALLIAAYGAISDYGRSISKPLLWAFGVWYVGGLVYRLLTGWPAAKDFGFSAASLGGVLGLRREIFPEVLKGADWPVALLSAGQSIAGALLLFLVGLALRNRFRIR